MSTLIEYFFILFEPMLSFFNYCISIIFRRDLALFGTPLYVFLLGGLFLSWLLPFIFGSDSGGDD